MSAERNLAAVVRVALDAASNDGSSFFPFLFFLGFMNNGIWWRERGIAISTLKSTPSKAIESQSDLKVFQFLRIAGPTGNIFEKKIDYRRHIYIYISLNY